MSKVIFYLFCFGFQWGVCFEKRGDVTSLAEMLKVSDQIIIGEVINVHKSSFDVKVLKTLVGKPQLILKIQFNSFENSVRWKVLEVGDTSFYFLLKLNDSSIYVPYGNFLEGEAPVYKNSVYFEQGLFVLYRSILDKKRKGHVESLWLNSYEDKGFSFKGKRMKVKNVILAIQGFRKIFVQRFEGLPLKKDRYKQALAHSQSEEDSLFLKYGNLVYPIQ